ncbi:MAG: tRNA pseudouridine synthase A [Bacteroidia bacterium]|nr:tRNA pseudouridine synthase A [Bacteroidia bacterium]
MHTLRLKVNDKVYNKLLGLLGKFNRDEIEIIADTSDFTKNQKYLAIELNEILNGTANFIEIEEAEQRLENVIITHENRI